MEDRKVNELIDEALSDVAGGASWEYDSANRIYIVYDKTGKEVYRFENKLMAMRSAHSLTEKESFEEAQKCGVPPAPAPVPSEPRRGRPGF